MEEDDSGRILQAARIYQRSVLEGRMMIKERRAIVNFGGDAAGG